MIYFIDMIIIKHNYIWTILIIFLTVKALNAELHWSYELWQTDHGLPQNSVRCLAQTNDGYLWIGTAEGLARFDGIRFKVYDTQNTPEIKQNYISAFLVDPEGKLWIGTLGGGITLYSNGKFLPYPLNSELKGYEINGIMRDSRDRVWISTSNGLFLQNSDDQYRLLTPEDGLLNSIVWDTEEDNQGRVWIATRSGLNLYANDTIRAIDSFNTTIENKVIYWISHRNDSLWIVSRDGLFLWNLNTDTWEKLDTNPNQSTIEAFYFTSNQILMGTNEGLFYYQDHQVLPFSKQSVFQYPIRSLFEDREKNLWIGTMDGLIKTRRGIIVSYQTQQGLSNNVAWSIIQDRAGKIWVGTDEGLNWFLNGKFHLFQEISDLTRKDIGGLALDHNGRIMIGTYDQGVYFYDDNGKIQHLTTDNGLSSGFVTAILEDHQRNIWIGTYGGGVNCYANGAIKNYNTQNHLLSHDAVTSILEYSPGVIWVGTENGINIIKDDSIMRYDTLNGLGSVGIQSLTMDSISNIVWIATNDGLSWYQNGQFFNIKKKDGLFTSYFYQVLFDEKRLWLSSNFGIVMIEKQNIFNYINGKNERVSCQVFDRATGLVSSECNGGSQPAGCRDRNGKFWFPTGKGVVAIDPGIIVPNQIPPEPIIEEMMINNLPIDCSGDTIIQLEAGTNRVEFYYTAINFLCPKRIQFKTRLKGFENDWNFVDTRRYAVFTNLEPGNYTFEIIAINQEGLESSASDGIQFRIKPFFYQRPGVWLLAVLLLMGYGYFLFRMRIRRFDKRQKELEQTVEEKTEHLRNAQEETEKALSEARMNHEIALEAIDTIQEQAQQLRLSNEKLTTVNHLKDEIMNIAVHDLRNPLTIIKATADILRRQNTNTVSILSHIDRIDQAITKMMHIINELLVSSAIESGHIKLNFQPVDIQTMVNQIVQHNIPNADRKCQSLTIDSIDHYIVQCDAHRIMEVMDNLVSNAIKYSPHGLPIQVLVKKENTNILFQVKDQGPGILPQDLQRLFTKFQKIGNRPTGGETSTGLGLSIAKKLTELHHGEIIVESEVGKGSVFTLSLPEYQQ